MKMRSCNFCHTNTKNPENNLGIFCLITGRPKLNGYRKGGRTAMVRPPYIGSRNLYASLCPTMSSIVATV